jgi:DNA ligase (NAD+)
LEKESPALIRPSSPTQRVAGAPIPGFKHVAHKIPMLSLNKCKTSAELTAFYRGLSKALGPKDIGCVVEPKVDGVAISLHYKNGILVRALTRGDGKVGDDVTANVRTIRGLPLALRGQSIPQHLEVRGEVYIAKADFKQLQKENQAANPRNLAVGSLKLLDPRLAAKRRLSIVCFDVVEASSKFANDRIQLHSELRSLGLPTPSVIKQTMTLKGLLATIDACAESRSRLGYQTDGVVVKLNDRAACVKLGCGTRAPHWAIAFKFPPPERRTRVLEVRNQVGRTGVITPVAIVVPVTINGSRIARATLHNYAVIQRLDLRIGDSVTLQLGGDIIPAVGKVLKSERRGDERAISVPTQCPSCQSPIVSDKVGIVFCGNRHCPERCVQGILHFTRTMEMKEIGPSLIQKLYATGQVKSSADLFGKGLKGVMTDRERSVLSRALDVGKAQPATRVLATLGIRGVGQGTAQSLLDALGSIQVLAAAKQADLEKIPRIGPVTASSIVSFFQTKETKALLGQLETLGFQTALRKSETPRTVFTGKICVVTGRIPGMTRKRIKAFLLSSGAKTGSTVTRKTTLLIVGDKPGAKLQKAKDLGIQIMPAKVFLEHTKKVSVR